MMWPRVATAAATIAVFATSWAAGMAIADPAPLRLVLSGAGASALTPIQIEGLYPTDTAVHPITVSLTASAPDALLAIEISGLEDVEQGCNHAERTSGDTTCGELEGELSQQLLVSAALTASRDCEDLTGATPALAAQSLAELAAAGTIDLDGGLLASGESRCLLLTFDLPGTADNLVQTDLTRFDLALHAEQALPDQEVAGEQERPDDGQQVMGETDHRGLLPNAGLAIAGLLALGGGGVAAGTWLVRSTRRRGRDGG